MDINKKVKNIYKQIAHLNDCECIQLSLAIKKHLETGPLFDLKEQDKFNDTNVKYFKTNKMKEFVQTHKLKIKRFDSSGIHLRFLDLDVDYWPKKQKFHNRKTKQRGQGEDQLIDLLRSKLLYV